MCAIAGIVGLPATEETLRNLLKTMERRGPDGNGIHMDTGCTLLHARLAIIDPQGGAQPMTLDWRDQQYVLVYNGELYNTEEIRQELRSMGHFFRGHSDTEVVLHAYAQWGRSCVDRFNGIFAMAVWEKKRNRLFLARDRIGVKPLFYTVHNGGVLFASEIKTILSYPSVHPSLDAEGAAQILLLGPGRLPGSGVFHGIRELEPGYTGWYEDGRLSTQQYWKLRDREHTQDLSETVETVRFLVTDAVKRQMVSDVPVGCFLSGGLDSSIISAICAGEKENLDTFSVGYQDNDLYFTSGKFQPNSDEPYIRIMFEAIGSRHHDTILTSSDLMTALPEATIARDLPGMADVDFSLLAFCGHVRNEVKVALSGECADEIFGGYPWYRDPSVRDTDGFPWAQNTAQRIFLLHPDLREKVDGEAFVRSHYLDTLNHSDILPGVSTQERRVKEMVNLNFRWFMQTLLDRKDRMSMYHGLEVRVPFCDYRIAEYLYGVPWEYKDLNGREKGLLRKAMEGLLPAQILSRKKSPYPKTHHPKYSEMMRQCVMQMLVNRSAPVFRLVSRTAVAEYIQNEPKWPWYGQLMTMPQTLAYLLQINFWLEHYGVDLIW